MQPWRWPGQWLKDEKFWREVGSRTLSAVIAAGIIYLFAIAAGYVRRPVVSVFVVSTLAAAFVQIGEVYLVVRLTRKNRRPQHGVVPTKKQLLRARRLAYLYLVLSVLFGGLLFGLVWLQRDAG